MSLTKNRFVSSQGILFYMNGYVALNLCSAGQELLDKKKGAWEDTENFLGRREHSKGKMCKVIDSCIYVLYINVPKAYIPSL
jgi:hypothetical protein